MRKASNSVQCWANTSPGACWARPPIRRSISDSNYRRTHSIQRHPDSAKRTNRSARRCRLAPWNEPLDSFVNVDLARVQVAARVDGEVVHPPELPRLPAAAAEASHDAEITPFQDPDLLVRAVGDEQVGLGAVA